MIGYLLGYLAGAGIALATAVCVMFVVFRVFRAYSQTAPARRAIALDLASSALLGMGVQLILMPPLLWWWLHGSPERYLWIISGPYPYDRFGSGPVQLWLGVFFAGTGFTLFSLGVVIRRKCLR